MTKTKMLKPIKTSPKENPLKELVACLKHINKTVNDPKLDNIIAIIAGWEAATPEIAHGLAGTAAMITITAMPFLMGPDYKRFHKFCGTDLHTTSLYYSDRIETEFFGRSAPSLSSKQSLR